MLLKAIEINMGADKTVTDPMYDRFFPRGGAENGVRAVLAAGRFFINGFPIPGTAEAFEALGPEGYLLNRSPWLSGTEGGYRVGRNLFGDYASAALAAATDFTAGLEVKLLDEDGDGLADRIDMAYPEAVIAGRITRNPDDTVSMCRAEPDPRQAGEYDGRAFDGRRFSAASDERIPPENLDPALREGELALFRYVPSGWELRRAREVRGPLADGRDHGWYQIGPTRYQDAMRFSRNNLPISNRCGEYLNAHRYFGLLGETGPEVSLWFVPTADPSLQAAPAGFTSGENAPVFLSCALDTAKKALSAAPPEADRTVLEQTVDRAERALEGITGPELLDYHTYLLYLALNGSDEDIGARFANYRYPRFGR